MPALTTLARSDWHILKPALPDGEVQPRMSVLHRSIARQVAEVIAAGRRPVSIAGD